MPSNHLILCHPLLLPPSIFPSIRVFSNESVLQIRWPKYWSFSFSISPSNEYSGLNICVRIWYLSVPFWLTLLCIIGSWFIHLIRTDSNVFLFIAETFHCIYVPQLPYPFICRWTSRLPPCPGYCKQCCDERYTCLFQFWFPQYACPAVGLLGCMAVLYFQFFEESPHYSPWWLY